MSSKKRIAAAVITIAALSVGSAGVASAHDKGAVKTNVLAELVKAGTITQAQSDAIAKKLEDARVAMDANRAAHKAEHDARHAAVEALVSTTIGVDAATIKTRLAAGETLAAIAGAKKDALVAALVAYETKEIDARVAAGKITAAQATAAKADLTKKVTSRVESNKGPKGFGPKDHKGGKGKGPRF